MSSTVFRALGAVAAITLAMAASYAVSDDVDVLRARSAEEDVVFGKVLSVSDQRLNIVDGETRRTLLLSPETIVEIDGKPVKLSDLPPQARVRIFLSPNVSNTATRVVLEREAPAANRLPADLPVGTPTPSSLPLDPETTAQLPTATVDTDPVPMAPIGATFETTAEGVLVRTVDRKGAAYTAGLREGDLIKFVADQNVASAEGLNRVWQKHSAGEVLTVGIIRGEKSLAVSLQLPRNHQGVLVNAPQPAPSTVPAVRGASVLTEAQIGWVLSNRNGVVDIVEIEPDTPAALSGLQIGDEVIRVAGIDVKSPEDVLQLIQANARGSSVALLVRRRGEILNRGLLLPTSTPVVVNKVTDGSEPVITGNDQLDRIVRQQAAQEQTIRELTEQIKALREELATLRGTPAPPPRQ